MYGAEVPPTLISNVTDAVTEDMKLWQVRPARRRVPDP
jgi:putative transposase